MTFHSLSHREHEYEGPEYSSNGMVIRATVYQYRPYDAQLWNAPNDDVL